MNIAKKFRKLALSFVVLILLGMGLSSVTLAAPAAVRAADAFLLDGRDLSFKRALGLTPLANIPRTLFASPGRYELAISGDIPPSATISVRRHDDMITAERRIGSNWRRVEWGHAERSPANSAQSR